MAVSRQGRMSLLGQAGQQPMSMVPAVDSAPEDRTIRDSDLLLLASSSLSGFRSIHIARKIEIGVLTARLLIPRRARRRKRDEGLDHQDGHDSAAGGRRDPHRL